MLVKKRTNRFEVGSTVDRFTFIHRREKATVLFPLLSFLSRFMYLTNVYENKRLSSICFETRTEMIGSKLG